MRIIWRIFKKELKDTLRDRRTLMMMLVIPILMFPIILTLFVSISESFQEDSKNKKLLIGINKQSTELIQFMSGIPEEIAGNHEIVFYEDSTSMYNAVESSKIDIGFFTNASFKGNLDNHVPAKVILFFDATKVGMEEKGKAILNIIHENQKNQRLMDMKIDPKSLNPFNTISVNTASPKEMIGQYGGAILPYLFIAFGFLGCMYPAIDLFTGEKERGTIETLLTTPVQRWQILLGKMKVVILSGLTASSFGLLGLWISIEILDIVKDPAAMKIIHDILSVSFIAGMFSLLIPLIIFFAGVMIPISIYTKTFKEAQSIITPLNIVMVLPAMIGFFPGIELNMKTACIPVVNIVLASKELMAGNLPWPYYVVTFFIMSFLASIAVFVSFKQFGKESNIVI